MCDLLFDMANSNEYMREYMKKRYQERKALAIEKLGGHCVRCGTTANLEFDHVDGELKRFEFSKIWNYKIEMFLDELRFGQLLCTPCHKNKTRLSTEVEHGGGLTGKRLCPCELCRAKKREYNRAYKKRIKDLKA